MKIINYVIWFLKPTDSSFNFLSVQFNLFSYFPHILPLPTLYITSVYYNLLVHHCILLSYRTFLHHNFTSSLYHLYLTSISPSLSLSLHFTLLHPPSLPPPLQPSFLHPLRPSIPSPILTSQHLDNTHASHCSVAPHSSVSVPRNIRKNKKHRWWRWAGAFISWVFHVA